MKTWLIDTGPLVSLLVVGDSLHDWSVEQSKHAPSTVYTCEAVLSEAFFVLRRDGHDAGALFDLVDAGQVRVDFEFRREHRQLRDLMQQYRDVPMSLADACLVRMTELSKDEACVWTLDRDFRLYRKNRRQSIALVAPW